MQDLFDAYEPHGRGKLERLTTPPLPTDDRQQAYAEIIGVLSKWIEKDRKINNRDDYDIGYACGLKDALEMVKKRAAKHRNTTK